jgi:serine/threonine protein kinase
VIADFGLSRVLELEDMLGIDTTVGGTLWYMAPELLQVPPKVWRGRRRRKGKETGKGGKGDGRWDGEPKVRK